MEVEERPAHPVLGQEEEEPRNGRAGPPPSVEDETSHPERGREHDSALVAERRLVHVSEEHGRGRLETRERGVASDPSSEDERVQRPPRERGGSERAAELQALFELRREDDRTERHHGELLTRERRDEEADRRRAIEPALLCSKERPDGDRDPEQVRSRVVEEGIEHERRADRDDETGGERPERRGAPRRSPERAVRDHRARAARGQKHRREERRRLGCHEHGRGRREPGKGHEEQADEVPVNRERVHADDRIERRAMREAPKRSRIEERVVALRLAGKERAMDEPSDGQRRRGSDRSGDKAVRSSSLRRPRRPFAAFVRHPFPLHHDAQSTQEAGILRPDERQRHRPRRRRRAGAAGDAVDPLPPGGLRRHGRARLRQRARGPCATRRGRTASCSPT